MPPVRPSRKQSNKLPAFTASWFARLLSGTSTKGGESCTRWHIAKLFEHIGGRRENLTRAAINEWIATGIARTQNYKSARVFLAANICRYTQGITAGDTRFFSNMAKKIVTASLEEAAAAALAQHN